MNLFMWLKYYFYIYFQIVSEEIEGKTISCLKRPDGDIYALVEAISRVYFYHKEISEVLHVVQNVLGIDIVSCTDSEEKAFISFYGLQISKLQVPSMMKVASLKQYLPVLKYMFQDKTKEHGDKPEKPIKSKVTKVSTKRKLKDETASHTQKLKHKKKKTKKNLLDGRKTLMVVVHDCMKSATLRKELCHLYQIKIKMPNLH